MEYPGFIGPSSVAQSLNVSQERTVNWYQETPDSQFATTRKALYPTPGVEAMTLTLPTIADPGAITITNQGTPGATEYHYRLVAYFAAGSWHTELGADSSTITGAATLNGTDFNRLTWSAITNANQYSVYRTAPGPLNDYLIIDRTTALTADDTGVGTLVDTVPSGNTTGAVIVPIGSGRAHYYDAASGREFAVIGSIFYEIGASGAITPRGTVTLDSNPATISSNGDGGGQLLICSGSNGYSFTLSTNAFAAISNLAGKATMGDMIDGYGLALDSATSTWYISDLLDMTTWDPTNFVQRSSQGDPWVALKVNGPYIYLLGSLTSETWYDAGSFPIPFAKHSSGNMPYGCAAPWSVEIAGSSIVWLGNTANGQGNVLRTNGFSPEVISTYAFQVALAQYTTLADAIGDTYEDLGHTFYVLTFPVGNATWCWDEKERAWHERGTWISEQSQFDAWHPMFHAFAYGEHRILDLYSGNVYRMSSNIATDVDDNDGTPRYIRRLRRGPSLAHQNFLLYYPEFELDLEPGIGLSGSGQGSNPTVMLRMSNDGGHTWGNELTASAGALGEYGTRVVFLRCGAGRRRVFEVSVTDPVPWRLLGAYLVDFERANPVLGQMLRKAG